MADVNLQAIDFTKMHGAGNDYIYIDGRGLSLNWPELAVSMSRRHFGIGSDGLIVARTSDRADIGMEMFNADGSVGMMCGNGIRCLVAFAIDSGMVAADATAIRVETASGVLTVTPIRSNGRVVAATVDMGAPRFGAAEVPFRVPGQSALVDYPLKVADEVLAISAVSMGNPHAVALLDEPVADFDLARIGPLVERDGRFPEGVNLEIVNVLARDRLRVRVWERGSGQTMACGTGACAAAVVTKRKNLTDDAVTVSLPGGDLRVTWPGTGPVQMEGPVERVFEGSWPL